MQRFKFGEKVEAAIDGEKWVPAVYCKPNIGATMFEHEVMWDPNQSGSPYLEDIHDAWIRPVPCFEATGDEVRLIDAALTGRLHDLTRADYEGGREVTDATLKVKDLRDRVRAAMGVSR